MRLTLGIVFFVFVSSMFTNLGYAQEWRDTLNQARKLYTKGNFKEALKYYKTAEQLAPNTVNLSEEIGQTAYKAGDYKTAEENYEAAAAAANSTKDKIRLNNNLAETRMKQKNYEGAIEAYKNVLRIDAENEKARQGLMEAKRQKEKSCKNPSNQNQNQQNQQNQQNNQNNQNQDKKENKSNNDGQQQGQQNKPQAQNQSGQKLENKQADRKLDELSRQEMGTKKRLGGTKGVSSGKSARKDW